MRFGFSFLWLAVILESAAAAAAAAAAAPPHRFLKSMQSPCLDDDDKG
jgi:hypothetical protein